MSDPEISALQQLAEILATLDECARDRAMRYLNARFVGRASYDRRAGGEARAASLSPQRRSEIASNAAKKRWANPEPTPER